MRNSYQAIIMQQNTLHCNASTTVFFRSVDLASWMAAGLTLGAGWIAFNSPILSEYGTPQLFMAGTALLVMAWRLGARTRLAAWAILAAWYLGAGSAMPSGWQAFFGNNLGWAGWAIWAGVAASPVLLFPARLAPYALGGGTLLSALTPVGMMSPLLAAAGFFPGGGWWGLAGAMAVLMLPSIPNKKLFAMAGILVVFWGAVQNAAFDAKPTALPGDVWAVETREGAQPSLAVDWFGRQGRVADLARDGVEHGARLTVTPEGTVDAWDVWAKVAWEDVEAASRRYGGMVLLGIYRKTASGWQNGLMDVASGEIYGAAVPMPISMWRPWSTDGHFPFDFSQLTRRISTPVGEAAYLICFEELLVFPMAAKMAAGDPSMLISAANQWFTNAETAEAQERSIRQQARLWGLPILRAVNWAKEADH